MNRSSCFGFFGLAMAGGATVRRPTVAPAQPRRLIAEDRFRSQLLGGGILTSVDALGGDDITDHWIGVLLQQLLDWFRDVFRRGHLEDIQ